MPNHGRCSFARSITRLQDFLFNINLFQTGPTGDLLLVCRDFPFQIYNSSTDLLFKQIKKKNLVAPLSLKKNLKIYHKQCLLNTHPRTPLVNVKVGFCSFVPNYKGPLCSVFSSSNDSSPKRVQYLWFVWVGFLLYL